MGVGEIPCEDSSVKEDDPCRCCVLPDDVAGHEQGRCVPYRLSADKGKPQLDSGDGYTPQPRGMGERIFPSPLRPPPRR